jgi:hypothetical protein
MEEIKEAFQPVVVEFFKFLAVLASLLLINILTILRSKVKDNWVKNKALSWAINKAIKMEGEEFEKFTNSEKWAHLVEGGAKVGITEAMLKSVEASIMGAVEAWKNDNKLWGGE